MNTLRLLVHLNKKDVTYRYHFFFLSLLLYIYLFMSFTFYTKEND
jgi:hypothetical protein